MPRNLTATTTRPDPAAKTAESLNLLALAPLLFPAEVLNPPPRTDLDGLPSWERDELLDAEFAAEAEEDRFLACQLDCLEDMGGPATDAEVSRWTARIEKIARKAAKARRKAEKAAKQSRRPLDHVTHAAGSTLTFPPPPVPLRKAQSACTDR